MNAPDTIYVFGFVLPERSGGFEWRVDRTDAANEQRDLLKDGDYDVSAVKAVRPIEDLGLPRTFSSDVAMVEAITGALDDAPELWEPTPGQRG